MLRLVNVNFAFLVDEAVTLANMAVFMNMGQCCCAGTRTFVQSKIYDEFIERAKSKSEKRRVGDPFDLRTEQISTICIEL